MELKERVCIKEKGPLVIADIVWECEGKLYTRLVRKEDGMFELEGELSSDYFEVLEPVHKNVNFDKLKKDAYTHLRACTKGVVERYTAYDERSKKYGVISHLDKRQLEQLWRAFGEIRWLFKICGIDDPRNFQDMIKEILNVKPLEFEYDGPEYPPLKLVHPSTLDHHRVCKKCFIKFAKPLIGWLEDVK